MISEDNFVKNYILSGEIVEIYETGKNRIAKIKFKPGFMDICIDKIIDLHLNDNIIIDTNIYINNIVQKSEEINFL